MAESRKNAYLGLSGADIFDQVLRRADDHNVVVDVAQTLARHPVWRRGKAENYRIVVSRDDLLVHRRGAAVRLVYDDDVSIAMLTPDQRLNAGNLN